MSRKPLSVLCLLFFLSAGCVDFVEETLDEGFGAIEGMVRDSDGQPVPGATVYFQKNLSMRAKTIGDGTFVFRTVPAGAHTLMAYSEAGTGATTEATVFGGVTTPVEIVLTGTGSLIGTVTLEGEQDHAGTLVYILGTASGAYTDDDGSYRIHMVIPGCFNVRAEHDGFYPKELEHVCIWGYTEKRLQEITLVRRDIPECLDDGDCEAHQVCADGLCTFESGFSEETCDGNDNDGDGFIDEGVGELCGTSQGTCAPGISLCLGGKMTECDGGNPPQDEICDTKDNDCDGQTDEDFDADRDGFTSCAGDCDDTNPAANPSATEVCDGVDNDCDGELDEADCPVECQDSMSVTVIDASSRQPISAAHVTVADADGTSHTADTDAAGIASFASLAAGNRRSITVASDQTVPPLPGASGPDRPRYEITSVLDQCTNEITVPLMLTASGKAARPTGTIVAKVPSSLFDMLPHSWKCTGDCTSDNDCSDTYYCEGTTAPCVGKCTPRSLLPFFSLGDANLSGQMRMVMLVPVFDVANFTYRDLNKIFAPPPAQEAVWQGNMATDDTFLNGLGPTLGLDPWGNYCVRNADCPYPGNPDVENFVCEEDNTTGEMRCKDKNPMRNVKMLVPAGANVKLAAVMGITDVDMVELLPSLLPFLTGDGEYGFNAGAMLTAFKMQTLHVCLLDVNVQAGAENNINDDLKALTANDCWSVDYQQQEVIYPVRDEASVKPSNMCGTDVDCGWPDSGKACRPDPQDPTKKYCFTPMFRVNILSSDTVGVLSGTTVFDPTGADADARLRSSLPESAPFEVMCVQEPGVYVSCEPPDIRDLPVPPDTDCSLRYGIALVSLDFPAGHAALPEGGRVFIGYNFNKSPLRYHAEPAFLVPIEVMDGSVGLSVTQMYFRSLIRTEGGPLLEVPGYLTAQASSSVMIGSIQLPPMLPVPALDPTLADAGFSVRVTFEAENPTVFPPTLRRVYATVMGALLPAAGVHELTYDLSETTLSGEDLKGVVLSRVDYYDTVTIVDPWWRIYARPGTTDISLPVDASPFSSGEGVWVTPFGHDVGLPFRYDLFPVNAVLGPLAKCSQDSYSVIVP